MRDDALEAKFQREGYVVIPFMTKEEVDGLKQKYFETLPHSGGQITASETGVADSRNITYDFTFIDKNVAYKREVFKIITEYFALHVEKWLADYKPIIANYIHKKGGGGEVPLHQNYAFVDERKCTSVSIWLPLVDSTEENGTLQIVPGSHKRFCEIRGPMVPWDLDDIKNEIINNFLVPLNTKAGNAVILDDSIVHYSAINKTNGLRLTIQLILIPEEFPSIQYRMNPEVSRDDVNILEVNHDFYMESTPWKEPEGAKKIGTLKYQHNPMSVDEFRKKLFARRFDEKELQRV